MLEYPNGIVYKLNCEVIYPTIANSIETFEEHTIIPNMASFDAKMVLFFFDIS
jgi:hypothetical protein